ncbi:MAG: hypothetical protein H6Q19_1127 [Bacteroidetes bacterium]|nr:hypothetical protein [Bacteroidota bacterium]
MKLIRRNIITVQEAEKLLEKYYEGCTTVTEENLLRTFLAQSNVPPQFEAEKAIFGYYESKKTGKHFSLQPYLKWAAAAAIVAGIIIPVSIFQASAKTNYAYINGVKITNTQEIISLAHTTINFVSDNNEVEDGLDNLKNDETIKNQLDAFSEIEL